MNREAEGVRVGRWVERMAGHLEVGVGLLPTPALAFCASSYKATASTSKTS